MASILAKRLPRRGLGPPRNFGHALCLAVIEIPPVTSYTWTTWDYPEGEPMRPFPPSLTVEDQPGSGCQIASFNAKFYAFDEFMEL